MFKKTDGFNYFTRDFIIYALIEFSFIAKLKVARNYSYVASTTAINNAAASQLPAIKLITR